MNATVDVYFYLPTDEPFVMSLEAVKGDPHWQYLGYLTIGDDGTVVLRDHDGVVYGPEAGAAIHTNSSCAHRTEAEMIRDETFYRQHLANLGEDADVYMQWLNTARVCDAARIAGYNIID